MIACGAPPKLAFCSHSPRSLCPSACFPLLSQSLLVSLRCSQVPVYSFIAHYMAMLSHCSPTDPHSFSITYSLSSALVRVCSAIAKEEARHEGVQKSLQAQFTASNEALEKLQAEYKPQIKMLTAATPKAA